MCGGLVLLSGWAALLAASPAHAATSDFAIYTFGRSLFDSVFNPASLFGGDIRPSSADGLVLTAVGSARDDYVPYYSVAVAYRCVPSGESDTRPCSMFARMLRLGSITDDNRMSRGLSLVRSLASTRTPEELNAALDAAELEWLEADVAACEGGIFALDSIRVADWHPDIHYTLQPIEDREIIMHPAMIRVTMSGSYTTSSYQGWVLAPGVPQAVRNFLQVMEPCWRPSDTPRPWRRALPEQ